MSEQKRGELDVRAILAERRRQLAVEAAAKKEEESLPEFLKKDGVYEISDTDLAQHFYQTVPPVIITYSKEGRGGDFIKRLNGEKVTRATTLPPWSDMDLAHPLVLLREAPGKTARRVIRHKSAYILGEKERDSEPDGAGRPSDSVRLTQLEINIPAPERLLLQSTITTLRDFMARYPNERLTDAETVRNEFFVRDTARKVTEDDRQRIQDNADEAEIALNTYREDLGGKEATEGLFELERIGDRKSWLHACINGGAKQDASFGRLFINIPPERMHAFFVDLVRNLLPEALTHNVSLDLKTIVRCTTVEVERIEKIVIYFNDQNVSVISGALNQLSNDYPELLQPSTQMPFTIPFKIHEQPFSAVTFAQQPKVGGSWAESRAKALVKTRELIGQGKSASDAFAAVCKETGINELHPAFEVGGEQHFVNTTKYLAGM